MTRYAMPALLIALALVGPAAAQGTDTKEDLAREVADLRKELAELRRYRDMDISRIDSNIKNIDRRLARIERALERLAARGTPDNTSRFTPAGTGTIKLDNRMDVEAYVTIDGTRYTVEPYGMRYLRRQPAGSLSYTVSGEGMGVGPRTRTTLAAGETLTLTIRPRPVVLID